MKADCTIVLWSEKDRCPLNSYKKPSLIFNFFELLDVTPESLLPHQQPQHFYDSAGVIWVPFEVLMAGRSESLLGAEETMNLFF